MKRPFIVVVENTTFVTIVYKSMLTNNTKVLNLKGVIKVVTKNEENTKKESTKKVQGEGFTS